MSVSISTLSAGVIIETKSARVSVAAPRGRLSLRARGDLDVFGSALGVEMPSKIGACARSGELEVLCLGPDEWTLMLPQDQVASIFDALNAIYEGQPPSLTEVSAREVTFEIEGTHATDLLSIGCPRDIESIPVGEARRTVFDGVTVVLWRDASTQFRMDVWNSFAPYLAQTLETGCKEIAAELA